MKEIKNKIKKAALWYINAMGQYGCNLAACGYVGRVNFN